jgi:hypothetical protein
MVSRGVLPVAAMLSFLHLLNFLNYTEIARYFDPPTTRSVLLVAFALVVMVRHAEHLKIHLAKSWDVYAFCALALVSAAYSDDPTRTLKYGLWLLLSVYVGMELSVRVKTANDLAMALLVVLLPASILVAAVNVTLGPVVIGTGRQFGALGSTHVDTNYAMNFICLYLALRVLPNRSLPVPPVVGWIMWAVLAWAVYQAIFGLTRSVWLGVIASFCLYLFRQSFSIRSLLAVIGGGTLFTVAITFVGLDRVLPEAVKGRLEVTESRIESGMIDPRIEGIKRAWRTASEHPQGTGYAVDNSHNSYMNVLLNLGWAGAILGVVIAWRTGRLVAKGGIRWLLFFSIGAVPLLMHAFFEVQNWPGQANFVPLLTWIALARATLMSNLGRPRSLAPSPTRGRVLDA